MNGLPLALATLMIGCGATQGASPASTPPSVASATPTPAHAEPPSDAVAKAAPAPVAPVAPVVPAGPVAPAAEVTVPAERVVDPATIAPANGLRVLLDEANTGISTASMVQLVMAPDTRPSLARTDRREVWYVVKGVGYATGYYDRESQTVSPER